jgi:hypothetical protein
MTPHHISETPGGGTERERERGRERVTEGVWIKEVVGERHSLCTYITWKPKTS